MSQCKFVCFVLNSDKYNQKHLTLQIGVISNTPMKWNVTSVLLMITKVCNIYLFTFLELHFQFHAYCGFDIYSFF